MALVLISSPSRTSNSIESGLSAANSQAPFEFQREDFSSVTMGDELGDARLNLPVSAGDQSSIFTAGDILKMSGFSDPNADGFYTVVSAAFGALQTSIICEEAFVSNASGGVMTIQGRENYAVIIKILNPDNTPGVVDQSFVYIPNADGYLFFDLGPVLAGIIENFGIQLFSYSISYAEQYDGIIQTAVNLPRPLDAVRGRRQIGKLLGANLWSWLLKPLTAGEYGRVFTDFHEPKICRKHKRTLDILFDSLLSDRVNPLNTITIKTEGLNINKVLDGASNSESILPAVWYDNPQMYALDMQAIAELPAFANSEYIKLSVLDGAVDLIKPLICRIVEPCTDKAIMLQWKNDIGGIDQWVFGYNQKVSEDVAVGEVIEYPITKDFSQVRNTKGRLIQEEVQRITMTAENLQENEVRGLKYIKSSPSLQIELDDNFYNVVVAGSFITEWDTQHSLHSFTVTIELPVEFDYFEVVPL